MISGVTPEGKLLNLIKQAEDRPRLKKELKVFTKITIVLITLIVLILIIFMADIFTSSHDIPELKINIPKNIVETLPVKNEVDEEKEVVTERTYSVSKEDVLKRFRLLGVITGDNVQVIIEDVESKETLFLNKGDSFKGFTIFEIKDSGVIVDYNGQKIELSM